MGEGFLRGGYGLVQQDISVLVNNTFQVTTSAIIVALKLAHMARYAKQGKDGHKTKGPAANHGA
jgi:S-adenosylmethionine synthetase